MSLFDEWNDYQEGGGAGGGAQGGYSIGRDGGGGGGVGSNPFDLPDDDDDHNIGGARHHHGGGHHNHNQQQQHGSGGAADDVPMFNVERLNWAPTAEQGAVVSMDVGNNVLLLGTAHNFVIRWNVNADNDAPHETLISAKRDERIHRVSICPAGLHVLVAMEQGAVYYLGPRRDKPVLLAKLKGVVVDSVAWYTVAGEARVQRVLVGSAKGQVWEAVLEDGKDKQCKKLFDLAEAGGDAAPVAALHVEECPALPGMPSPRFFVMAATATRYYEFAGQGSVEAVLARAGPHPHFVELPGSLGYTELRFSRYPVPGAPPAAGAHGPAHGGAARHSQSFAWLTAAGLFQGQLAWASRDRVVADGALVEYPVYPDLEKAREMERDGRGLLHAAGGDGRGPRLAPLSVVLTEAHFLLLFRDRVVAINQLSKEIVWERPLARAEVGTPQRLVYDQRHGAVWLCCDRCVCEIEVTDETRDVWRILLQRGEFAAAERAARWPADRDQVRNAHADALFARGDYAAAAAVFARTSRSFEEVTLKLVGPLGGVAGSGRGLTAGGFPLSTLPAHAQPQQPGGLASAADARAALATYLRSLLRRVGNSELTQLTLLSTWLCELHLDAINAASDPAADPAYAAVMGAAAGPSVVGAGGVSGAGAGAAAADIHAPADPAAEAERRAALARAQQRAAAVTAFRDFVDEFGDCLPRESTLELIGAHGLVSEMLYYAGAINDTAFVLDYYAQHGRHAEALALLAGLPMPPPPDASASAAAARRARGNKADGGAGGGGDDDGKDASTELIVRLLPSLMPHLPAECVDLLVKRPAVPAMRVVPAFLRCGIAAPDAADKHQHQHQHQLQSSKSILSGAGATTAGGAVPSSALARATEARLGRLGLSSAVIVSAGGSSTGAALPFTRTVGAAGRTTTTVAQQQQPADAAPASTAAPARAGPTVHEAAAVRYLTHVLADTDNPYQRASEQWREPLLHNLLLSLLVRTGSDDALLAFIHAAGREPRFDVTYALRLCRAAQPPRLRACVELLRGQRLYRDAVALALDVSEDLAKEVLLGARADLAGSPEVTRQLWLLVAQRMVSAGHRTRTVIEALRAVQAGLSLEDVLACAPDFTRVGDFRDEIAAALADYAATTADLRRDMDALTAAAAQIRHDVARLGGRSAVVTARQRCDLCSQPALLRPFVLFPCAHAFHEDCALKAAREYLAASATRRQRTYEAVVAAADPASYVASLGARVAAGDVPADVERALCEEFVQSQCALCGDMMLESVVEPFVDPEAEADEIASWVI